MFGNNVKLHSVLLIINLLLYLNEHFVLKSDVFNRETRSSLSTMIRTFNVSVLKYKTGASQGDRFISFPKLQMSLETFQVLSSLPTSLSCTVLGNWLDLKSICRLDSALCEKLKRAACLKLLQSIECIGIFGCWKDEQLGWLNRRSIRTSEIFVSDLFSREVIEGYLQRFGHHIRSVHEGVRMTGKYLSLIARYCHNLVRYQSYSRSYSGAQCSSLLRANPCLIELTIACELTHTPCLPLLKYLCLFGPSGDAALVKGTKQLTFLSVANSSVTSSGMIEAAPYCPSLKYFIPPNVADIDYTLAEVTKECVHIQHLDLSGCVNLSDAGITAVARHVLGLRTIHFSYSVSLTNLCLHSLAEHQRNTMEEGSVIEVFDAVLTEPPSVILDDNRETLNATAVEAFRLKCTKLRVFDWQRLVAWHTLSAVPLIVPLVLSADRVTTLFLFFVNDVVLSAVAINCKQLPILEFAYCTTVNTCSDAMLLQVAEQCPTLRIVNVESPLVRRLQQLYAVYPHIQVHSGSGSVYYYNLQSLYRKNHKNE